MVSPNSGQGHENVTFGTNVHNQVGNSGKQINAMSLDELLKNVISVEDGSSASSSNSTAPYFLENLNPDGALSKKNTDDVWKEIVQQENVDAIYHNRQGIHGQLGETILEEYFVRNGVFNQNCVLNPQPLMAVDATQDWLKYQMVQHQEHDHVALMEPDFPASESMYKNQVVDVAYSNKQVSMATMQSSGTSSDSQVASEKKRRYSYEMDKTIERRQKRMIKNRESAARSRARKQAHTILLEEEVGKLKKKNSLLEKQKAVDAVWGSAKLDPQPKYQLRRTSSAKF